MTINPSKDGVDHINLYSRGKTSLGRFLSNFYRCKISTSWGNFESIEGFWYYLSFKGSVRKNLEINRLRNLWGYEARKYGEFIKNRYKDSLEIDLNFEQEIMRSVFQKIMKNRNEIIINIDLCDLPFEHYYVYDDKIINVKNDFLWWVEGTKKIVDFVVWLYG